MTLAENVESEDINGGGFAGSRHTRDADSAGVSGRGEAFFNDLLGNCLMGFGCALYKSHRSAQYAYIPFEYPFYIVVGTQLRTALYLSVRIDSRLRGDPVVDCQTFIFFCVFGMVNHGV